MEAEQEFKASLRRRAIESEALYLLKQQWGFSAIDYGMAWRNMDEHRRAKLWSRATQLVDEQGKQ